MRTGLSKYEILRKTEGWFNTSPFRNALSQLVCACITVKLDTSCNSMHKMWFFTILKPYFTIKMWDDSWFILTDGYLYPSSQELISYFSFITTVFPIVFYDCCWLLQRLKLNTSSWRNALWTGLDTSSVQNRWSIFMISYKLCICSSLMESLPTSHQECFIFGTVQETFWKLNYLKSRLFNFCFFIMFELCWVSLT